MLLRSTYTPACPRALPVRIARISVLGLGLAILPACGGESAPASSEPNPQVEAGAVQTTPAPKTALVDSERLIDADTEPGAWMSHGRTYSEQRFSPLTQITKQNVSELGLAWSYDLGSRRGVEATPIVVDGVMYLTASWSQVFALDAKTGEPLWTYDPEVPGRFGRNACCDVVNRGVAVWKGSVFVGTLDGRLISLDAATGDVRWSVQTTDPSRPYTITGAPRVVKDKVIIGNGGAELGVRGYITAYDAQSGEQQWRFYTVPGDPSKPFEHPELAKAAETWTGEWWEVGGGGTAWDSMAYDPELDLLYVGTGNGSPWSRAERSPGGGDNLFLSSILALRPDDGTLVWHYQTTPGGSWDYTATQHIVLADLEIDGAPRKVLMQAPKNGFFYVLDRQSGELISGAPYVAQTWASGLEPGTGRPILRPEGDYGSDPKLILPGPLGGHNWHPMSYNPTTGLVYLPAHDLPFWFSADADFTYEPGGVWNTAVDFHRAVLETAKAPGEVKGQLLAWDPVAQKPAWRVPHAGGWNGGVVSTASGLVFQGTGDGGFRAFDGETGDVLWEVKSDTGMIAAPISYAIDGEQYVAVAAGWGGGSIAGGFDPTTAISRYQNEGRVLVFKLGASQPLPRNQVRDLTLPAPPPLDASAETVEAGQKTYDTYCIQCHGFFARSSLLVPDLRAMPPERYEIFESIVLGGALEANGMPRFDQFIQPEELPALRAYIVSEAQRGYEEQQAAAD